MQERQRIAGLLAEAADEHFYLTPVEEALAYAPVLPAVRPCAVPFACCDEGTGSVAEEDGPQPLAHLFMVGCRRREVLEGLGAAVDDRFRLRSDCSVQGIEQVVCAVPVAVADAQSGQVDQGFQGVPGFLRAQGLGGDEGLGGKPAQIGRHVPDGDLAAATPRRFYW
ncbi:hypothetical protein, partial [Streptomyces coelicoflavus]|uniref:hypothetical protein n=1 Tax=Streptomyces coelicoflavus TaxID=285562 RepID=UPI0036C9503E